METIGVRELRDNLSRVLREVEKGKVVRVLRHGRDVVELRPVRPAPERDLLERLEALDVLGTGTGRIGAVKTVPNRDPERPVSDLVGEERR